MPAHYHRAIMDNGVKRARARLLLQSEAAMGLKQVRRGAPLIAKAVAAPVRHAKALDAAPPKALAALRAAPASTVVASPGSSASLLPVLQADLPPFTAPPLSIEEKRQRLSAMDDKEVRGCVKCILCKTRTRTVFGEGDCDARIFFIGEGPGENEDLSGRPFVGKAGQLLDRMIVAMGLSRSQVFIANIVKCRPPNNRAPMPDETAACTPYLERQLEIVRPSAIVTLGRPATLFMLSSNAPMKNLRGQWHRWRGIPLMPTFHPAYLLRSYTTENREMVWSDLQQVMAMLGIKPPARPASR
jgi:uracil-DNA glycosylase